MTEFNLLTTIFLVGLELSLGYAFYGGLHSKTVDYGSETISSVVDEAEEAESVSLAQVRDWSLRYLSGELHRYSPKAVYLLILSSMGLWLFGYLLQEVNPLGVGTSVIPSPMLVPIFTFDRTVAGAVFGISMTLFALAFFLMVSLFYQFAVSYKVKTPHVN